jgi:hypothetical protein
VSGKSFPLAFFGFLFLVCAFAPAAEPSPNKGILEKPLKAELSLRIGSDKANEDFDGIPTFAIGKNHQIYVLDPGNSRIQCFSREGKFLFGFGRRGQGPGELSDRASKIKALSDGNIYVIDNPPRKIQVYNQDGRFLFSAKTSEWYNDIVRLNGSYYLSSIVLEEGHRPVHVCRSLEKIDADFGIFIEPAVGILKQISRLPMPEPWRIMYGDSNFTNLAATSRGELIFSQGSPYRLIKYDARGKVLKDIAGDVAFDTYLHVQIISDRDSPLGRVIAEPDRAGMVFGTSIKNDDRVVVPYSNREERAYYIDIYDLDLNLISRYKLQSLIADTKKGESTNQIMIDDNDLYVMVISKEDYPRLVRFRLYFDREGPNT